MSTDQRTAEKSGDCPPLRRFERLLFLIIAMGTALFSHNVVGSRLFLVYVYGWDKVHLEHLRLLKMPKGRDWSVSNGEMIHEGFFVHYLISLACWFVMFLMTYPFLRRLLPEAKPESRSPYLESNCLGSTVIDPTSFENISNCTWKLTLLCPRRWSGLRETADPNVRLCETCLENVHLCFDDAGALRHTALGRRVALTGDVLTTRRC